MLERTDQFSAGDNGLFAVELPVNSVAPHLRLCQKAQFADKKRTVAMASLEGAWDQVRRTLAYVERIVQLNQLEPQRECGILAPIVVGLVV